MLIRNVIGGGAFGPSLLLAAWIWKIGQREAVVKEPVKPSSSCFDCLWLGVILVAWRWPFLLRATEYNPDESQFIAGAITLTRDPVFWRSVDGMTSGPLNFYILLPLHWLGLPLDYFAARLTGLLLIWGALVACHRTLSQTFGRTVAWLGLLPTLFFFATATHPDLIHYSSEHLTILLIAGATCLLAGYVPGRETRLWWAGSLAGVAPWAKLQAIPLSLAVIGWAVWLLLERNPKGRLARPRRLGQLLFWSAVPTFLVILLLLVTGQAETAFQRYFLHNLIYTTEGATLRAALSLMAKMSLVDGRLPWLLLIVVTTLVAAAIHWRRCRLRPPALFLPSFGLTTMAVFAVVAPRREFLHYTLLLPIPLALLLGTVLGGSWAVLINARARILFLSCFLILSGLPFLVTRGQQPPPDMFGRFAQHWRHPRSSAGELIHALAQQEDRLAIWGWASNLYVETGLPQATRDATSVLSIVPGDQRDYFRACYLQDIIRHRPAVFVGAVGPGGFLFETRWTQSYKTFPELADYIRENYTLVKDLDSARIFARNDLASLETMTEERLSHLIARGRPEEFRGSPKPPLLDPKRPPVYKTVHDQQVMMLLPPTRVEWPLESTTREVAVEFGFDPMAYEQGTSNGAEIILELITPHRTRSLWRRQLNPASRAKDRGPQTAVITLPVFAPGARLVLRSEPGEHGDDAWDWLYLASMKFRETPAYLLKQFPRFNRVPDKAQTAFYALDQKMAAVQLHAPSTLSYLLRGNERFLVFQYGFHPGAYTKGGHTDGAIFRVEVLRMNQAPTLLFEHRLNPADQSADQGFQYAHVPLLNLKPDDTLTISIDPGPAGNPSWDWTFISRLTLD